MYWLAKSYPVVYATTYAIPNAARRSAIQGAWMKAEGMKAGVPDLCIAHPSGPYPSMYLEMKSAKGVLSPSQKKYLSLLRGKGFYCVVAYSLNEAIELTEGYLGIRSRPI